VDPVEAPSPEALTGLLQAWSRGDVTARDQLLPLVYAELRRRAAGYLRREQRGHTLQPTALVHEAYIRLSGQNAGWKNRAQFFAVSSQIMRRILVDHARARRAAKRPGRRMQVTLVEEEAVASGPRELDLIALDEALDQLAAADPRQAQMVELRFFGGLTHEEVASVLGVSLATVNREWRLAKAWLYQRVAAGD
jgi:RNA polymerase sigma-70 factor (ECF subfamily)